MTRSCKIHNESRPLYHWIASHTHWRASSTHWRAIASRAPSNKQPQSFQTRCNRARVAGLVSTGTIDLVSGTNLYDSTAQDVIAGYQYRLCMTTHDSIGRKRYELSNLPKAFGIGNVLVAISDRKMQVDAGSDGVYDYFLPDVWVTNDYYPFGMLQPGRNFSSEGYRFGFNGQEKDDEIAGTGSYYTAEYWMYDSRIGRRWNVDPVLKYWESPFACFDNGPIFFIDPFGNVAGDYYNKDGSYIGSDGEDDGKVYYAEKDYIQNASTLNKDDLKYLKNILGFKELEVNHSTFQQIAAFAYNEESNFQAQLGVTSVMKNRKSSWSYTPTFEKVLSTAAGSSVGESHEDRLKNDEYFERYTTFSNTSLENRNNNSVMKNANLAALRMLSGDKDYSNGALFWHGVDFFTKGWKAYEDEYLKYGFKWEDGAYLFGKYNKKNMKEKEVKIMIINISEQHLWVELFL
jgi:hypothetical protein